MTKDKVFIGGMIAFIVVSFFLLSSGGEEKTKNEQTFQEILKESEIIPVELGKEVELATKKLTIKGSEETDVISSSYSTPIVANEGTKFVVVEIEITNTTKTSTTFFPDHTMRLIDEQEREYLVFNESIGNIENYLNVRELAPDIKETGVLVYLVPEDAKQLSIAVAKGGTNELYKLAIN